MSRDKCFQLAGMRSWLYLVVTNIFVCQRKSRDHDNLKTLFLNPGPGDALPCMSLMFPCSDTGMNSNEARVIRLEDGLII